MTFSERRVGRLFDPSGQVTLAEARALSDPQVVQIAPPWGGYTPDLAVELTDWRDSQWVSNLVTRQGVLAFPDGYERAGSATLPLGDGVNIPAAAGLEEPIVLLKEITDSNGQRRQYALTAEGPTGNVNGDLYELQSGAWTFIPTSTAPVGFSGDTTGAGVAQTLCDAVYHSLSDQIFFANNVDQVRTHQPGTGTHATFSSGSFSPFLAQSVEVADGRVLFFNTSEVGVRYPTRIRTTTIGGTPSLSGLGATFIDFDELEGPGLRIRKLGNVIACYLADGVVFLRRQASAASPYTREYLDRRLGLVGPFASCDVGRNIHFGIYNEGWFLLREDGVFQEVGLRTISGRTYRKFADTFYSQLNDAAKNRVYVECELNSKQITILWPSQDSSDPDRRWVYDLDTDSVWPMDDAETPNVLGRFSDTEATVGWDDTSDTWDAVTGGWGDFDQRTGRVRITSGTRSGLVYRYRPSVFTFDGTAPVYRMVSFPILLGEGVGLKTWEKFYVGYERLDGAGGPPITIALHNENGQVATQSLVQTAGLERTLQFVYLHGRPLGNGVQPSPGARLAWEVSGTHPVRLHSFVADYRRLGMELRREP